MMVLLTYFKVHEASPSSCICDRKTEVIHVPPKMDILNAVTRVLGQLSCFKENLLDWPRKIDK